MKGCSSNAEEALLFYLAQSVTSSVVFYRFIIAANSGKLHIWKRIQPRSMCVDMTRIEHQSLRLVLPW